MQFVLFLAAIHFSLTLGCNGIKYKLETNWHRQWDGHSVGQFIGHSAGSSLGTAWQLAQRRQFIGHSAGSSLGLFHLGTASAVHLGTASASWHGTAAVHLGTASAVHLGTASGSSFGHSVGQFIGYADDTSCFVQNQVELRRRGARACASRSHSSPPPIRRKKCLTRKLE